MKKALISLCLLVLLSISVLGTQLPQSKNIYNSDGQMAKEEVLWTIKYCDFTLSKNIVVASSEVLSLRSNKVNGVIKNTLPKLGYITINDGSNSGYYKLSQVIYDDKEVFAGIFNNTKKQSFAITVDKTMSNLNINDMNYKVTCIGCESRATEADYMDYNNCNTAKSDTEVKQIINKNPVLENFIRNNRIVFWFNSYLKYAKATVKAEPVVIEVINTTNTTEPVENIIY